MTMTCDQTAPLLHALLDGELDAGHAHAVEVHLAGCARCATQLNAYRDLRHKLKSSDLRFSAPASLRGRIDRMVPAASPNSVSRRAALKGFAAGSLISAAAAASLLFIVARHDRDTLVSSELVSAHLRSLQADHLTDVQSTDQHTVKPWFNGRLDVSPPVVDLTAQGFTLLGGRLDYIDGKPVAVIVYRRRKHIINLFVLQQPSAIPATAKLESVQGFNIRRWTDRGLALLAVSDINPDELEEFVTKFEAALHAGGPA